MGTKTRIPLEAVFFENANGRQPVRDFIMALSKEDKKEVGADIRIVQDNFPIGFPLVRKLKPDLWEIRTFIKDGICRVFFTISDRYIILLHAIVKKTKKTPPKEITVASDRLKEFRKMKSKGEK